MSALPASLLSSVRISWHISSWCNYRCEYCGVLVFQKRARGGAAQAHAFDHHPVERWLEAFYRLPQRDVYLKITGGEPFLDRENFRRLLTGLTSREKYTLRIDTNGSWEPAYFAAMEKRRILLNVSYHPAEIPLETFIRRINAIRAAGFDVTMINFVLAPENMAGSESALERLEGEGFFVNVSAMIPAGAYMSRESRSPREVELVQNSNCPIDVHFRLGNPVTKGRPCFHPAISYYMLHDGRIRVYCGGEFQDIFTDGPPPLPRAAVPCPYDHCEGCVEMYRALADEPRVTAPLGLFPLNEYVQEVKRHRTEVPNLSFRATSEAITSAEVPPPLIPAGRIAAAHGGEDVTGYIDVLVPLEARGRDRIQIQGWAAGAQSGAPVSEVRLAVAGRQIGAVHDFSERPDVARTLGRPDFLRSGWSTMAYLPALQPGTYPLTAEVTTRAGALRILGSKEFRIIE